VPKWGTMADYVQFGIGSTLFDAYGGADFAAAMLYRTTTEIGLANPDGSKTYIIGSGFVWDAGLAKFTAGRVTAVNHYDTTGAFQDGVSALSLPVRQVQAAFENQDKDPTTLARLTLRGNDDLDAHERAGGAIVPANLSGLAGDDTIEGGGSGDLIGGGSGNDWISSNAGDDRIDAGAGEDIVDAGTGQDVIRPGTGDDSIWGGPDPDIIVYGGLWTELAATYSGIDYSISVTSAEGSDRIFTALTIATDDGVHRYDVPTGQWLFESGDSGLERLYPDRIVIATASNDAIDRRGPRAEGATTRGLAGDDLIVGGELAFGGSGNDRLTGMLRAYGEDGNDRITSARYANGGPGKDLIVDAPDGTDDRLVGGGGNDICRFDEAVLAEGGLTFHGDDLILDFQLGADKIDIHFSPAVPPGQRTIRKDQAGPDTVLSYGGGTITLKNFDSTGIPLSSLLL